VSGQLHGPAALAHRYNALQYYSKCRSALLINWDISNTWKTSGRILARRIFLF